LSIKNYDKGQHVCTLLELTCVDRQRRLLCYPLARALVFKKVRKALGLDRCRVIISGAAPIRRETLEFFMSLDMPLMEGYGMSESSGMLTHCVSDLC